MEYPIQKMLTSKIDINHSYIYIYIRICPTLFSLNIFSTFSDSEAKKFNWQYVQHTMVSGSKQKSKMSGCNFCQTQPQFSPCIWALILNRVILERPAQQDSHYVKALFLLNTWTHVLPGAGITRKFPTKLFIPGRLWLTNSTVATNQ